MKNFSPAFSVLFGVTCFLTLRETLWFHSLCVFSNALIPTFYHYNCVYFFLLLFHVVLQVFQFCSALFNQNKKTYYFNLKELNDAEKTIKLYSFQTFSTLVLYFFSCFFELQESVIFPQKASNIEQKIK